MTRRILTYLTLSLIGWAILIGVALLIVRMVTR